MEAFQTGGEDFRYFVSIVHPDRDVGAKEGVRSGGGGIGVVFIAGLRYAISTALAPGMKGLASASVGLVPVITRFRKVLAIAFTAFCRSAE